ncbi:pentatricopeptide repeat-containing protein At3g09040, mitochondrial-like [Tasmannia lanceolata]|uniref:pentatricopeptide repeat-containing protein At3g09040, mitochondrial-like n=1 Tax=Tasmannia lanceolata TaxID=3420 RepID=UPI0040646854
MRKPFHVLPFPFKIKIPLNSNRQLHTAKALSFETFPSFFNISERKDPAAFATLLCFSSKTKSPFLGNQIHAQIIKLGFSNDIFSQNNLLVMYSKCEVLSSALGVFDEMRHRNLVSWTSMISGAIQNGELKMGLELYVEMTRSGFRPNEFAFGSVLKACAGLELIRFGSLLHCIGLKIGIDLNVFVGSSLLYMYAKCGDIEAAECLFGGMSDCDISCWNAMVGGYVCNDYSFEAMKLISFMHRKGIAADQFTFTSALKGCSISGDLKFGRQIHCLIVQNGMEYSSSVMNSLISMYFKAGRNDCALTVFNKMQRRDIISWNSLISGFAQDENVGEVMSLFSKMLLTGFNPNHVTFSSLFRLCGALYDIALGLQFYCLAYRLGFLHNALVSNSLIDMFSRCGVIENACFVFERLPTRTIVTWNEMIFGYSLNGYSIEALRLFCNLRKSEIKADEFTYSIVLGASCNIEHQEIGRQIHASILKSGFDSNCFVCCSLINAYASFGMVEASFKIFLGMKVLDLASWGAMVSAFSQQGCSYEALLLLNDLRESGEKPDELVLGSALNACANVTAFNQSKCIHLYVIKAGFEKHLCVGTAIIDAYAKCGDIDSSRMAFDSLNRHDDPVLFNTMITAFAQHGFVMEAIELFDKMKQASIQPTHASFVSLISACTHLGLVDHGCRFFASIRNHGMNPSAENYGCLIDLLARHGFLEEAKHVIEDMPFEPWPAVWRSLLSSCRIHGNRELGELAAERLLNLVPNNDAAYVLLSKVYAEEGSWEDAGRVRRIMNERGVQKEAGYSWVEI